jgi:hypothetical protein
VCGEGVCFVVLLFCWRHAAGAGRCFFLRLCFPALFGVAMLFRPFESCIYGYVSDFMWLIGRLVEEDRRCLVPLYCCSRCDAE